MNRAGVEQGFTLIELMLVIVIISIFAAMVSLSVGGSEDRQRLQARERLEDNLSLIQLESEDRAQVLGVRPSEATQDRPAGYEVVSFKEKVGDQPAGWQADSAFAAQTLPEGVTLSISPLNQTSPRQTLKDSGSNYLTDAKAPRLLWYGNGEATPVRLQLNYDNKPLGEPLFVTLMGQVSDNEQGRSTAS